MDYAAEQLRLQEAKFERDLFRNVSELIAADKSGPADPSSAVRLRRCLKDNYTLRDQFWPILEQPFFLAKWTDAGDMVAASAIRTAFVAETVFYDFVLARLPKEPTPNTRSAAAPDWATHLRQRCTLAKIRLLRNELVRTDPELSTGRTEKLLLSLQRRLRMFLISIGDDLDQSPLFQQLFMEAARMLTFASMKLVDIFGQLEIALENFMWMACLAGSRPTLVDLKHLPWVMELFIAISRCLLTINKNKEVLVWMEKGRRTIALFRAVEERISGSLRPDQHESVRLSSVYFDCFAFLATVSKGTDKLQDEYERLQAPKVPVTKQALPRTFAAYTQRMQQQNEVDPRKPLEEFVADQTEKYLAKFETGLDKLQALLFAFEQLASVNAQDPTRFTTDLRGIFLEKVTGLAVESLQLVSDEKQASEHDFYLFDVRAMMRVLFREQNASLLKVAGTVVELTLLLEDKIKHSFAYTRCEALIVQTTVHICQLMESETSEQKDIAKELTERCSQLLDYLRLLPSMEKDIDQDGKGTIYLAWCILWQATRGMFFPKETELGQVSDLKTSAVSFLSSVGLLDSLKGFITILFDWRMETESLTAVAFKIASGYTKLDETSTAKILLNTALESVQEVRRKLLRGNKSGMSCDLMIGLVPELLGSDTDTGTSFRLGCLELELLSFLFRLEIVDIARKISVQESSLHEFERICSKLCNTDPRRRAVFWISLVSMSTSEFTLAPFHVSQAFERAKNDLDRAAQMEEKLVRQLTPQNDQVLTIVGRDNRSIWVKPVETHNASWCQIFCRRGTVAAVTTKDASYFGTGVFYRLEGKDDSFEITGLEENETFTLGIMYFDNEFNPLHNVVKCARTYVTSSLPLSSLQTWTYLARAALKVGNIDLASEARHVLRGKLLRNKIPTESISLVYKVDPRTNLTFLDLRPVSKMPPFLRQAIAETFLQIAMQDPQLRRLDDITYDPLGTRQTVLENQSQRIAACLDLALALELALSAEDHELAALLCLESNRLLVPFLRMKHCPELIVSASVVNLLVIQENLESVEPRIRYLLADAAAGLYYGTIHHLNKRSHEIKVGLLFQTLSKELWKLYPDSDASVHSSTYLGQVEATQFLTSERHRAVAKLTAAQVERFVDKANTVIALKQLSIPSPLVTKLRILREVLESNLKASSALEVAAPKELGLSTTMADLMAMMREVNLDLVYSELSHFRKNIRYLEIISVLLRHSFSTGAFDYTIKIAMGTFAWLHGRNVFVLYPDSVSDAEKKSWRRKGYYKSKSATTGNVADRKNMGTKNAKGKLAAVVAPPIIQRSPDNVDVLGMQRMEFYSKEDGKRILQTVLPAVWKRIRYRRRLRSILEHESIWRAQILCTFAQSLMEKAERVADGADLNTTPSKWELSTESSFSKPSIFETAFDATWFQPGVTGTAVLPVSSSATTEAYEIGQREIDSLQVPDILQSFTQACVLSSRYHNWLQLLNAMRHLMNAHSMISRFQIAKTKAYEEYLWKSMYIASEALLSMLEVADVVFVHQVNGVKSEKRLHKLTLPTLEDLQDGAPWNIQGTICLLRWKDKQGCLQEVSVNLAHIFRFVLLAIQELQRTMHYHRLLALGHRFNMISNYAYGEYVLEQMIIAQKETEAPAEEIAQNKRMLMMVQKARVNCRNELQKCRQRAIRYLNQQALVHFDKDRVGSALVHGKIDNVISGYRRAIEEAARCGDNLIISKSLNELGDFYFNANDVSAADAMWRKALDIYSTCKAVSTSERMSLALIRGKLSCFGNSSNRDEKIIFALELVGDLSTVIEGSLPRMQGLWRDRSASVLSAIVGLDPFADKFAVNITLFIAVLLQVAEQLIDSGFAPDCTPAIAFVDFLIQSYCPSKENVARVLLLRASMYSHCGLVKEAMSCCAAIRERQWLNTQDQRKFFSNSAPPSSSLIFDNELGLTDAKNRQTLKEFLRWELPDNAKAALGPKYVRNFLVMRIHIVMRLFLQSYRFGKIWIAAKDERTFNETFSMQATMDEVFPEVETMIKISIAAHCSSGNDLSAEKRAASLANLSRLYQYLAEIQILWKNDHQAGKYLYQSIFRSLESNLTRGHAHAGMWLDLRLAYLCHRYRKDDEIITGIERFTQECATFQSSSHFLQLLARFPMENKNVVDFRAVPKQVLAQYFESMGDHLKLKGSLDEAQKSYETAFRELHSDQNSFKRGLHLPSPVIAHRWDLARVQVKSSESGGITQDLGQIVPVSIYCSTRTSSVEDLYVNVRNTMEYDPLMAKSTLARFLDVVAPERMSAFVHILAKLAQVRRYIHTNAFTVAEELQQNVRDVPKFVVAAYQLFDQGSSMATPDVADISTASVTAIMETIDNLSRPSLYLEQAVSTYLKLENESCKVRLPSQEAAIIEDFRRKFHEFFAAHSGSYRMYCTSQLPVDLSDSFSSPVFSINWITTESVNMVQIMWKQVDVVLVSGKYLGQLEKIGPKLRSILQKINTDEVKATIEFMEILNADVLGSFDVRGDLTEFPEFKQTLTKQDVSKSAELLRRCLDVGFGGYVAEADDALLMCRLFTNGLD